jgi:hypothetical protein
MLFHLKQHFFAAVQIVLKAPEMHFRVEVTVLRTKAPSIIPTQL